MKKKLNFISPAPTMASLCYGQFLKVAKSKFTEFESDIPGALHQENRILQRNYVVLPLPVNFENDYLIFEIRNFFLNVQFFLSGIEKDHCMKMEKLGEVMEK